MRLEDQHRFQIEAGYDGTPFVFIWCTRCEEWTRSLTEPVTFDELDDLADGHAEVCK